jgi:imidazolonepropionase-like amidohydrolase
MSSRLGFLILVCLASAGTVTAEPVAVQAFVGAHLIPIAGEPIDDGVLVVEDGRIAAVGPRSRVRVPSGAEVHDLTGKTLMPGLVCTHEHVGEPWGGDRSGPLQPEVRALDAINARHAGIQRAQAGGLTTANLMPGSGHLMGGQTAYIKFRDAGTVEELVLRDAEGRPMGGLKMANGTNPQGEPPFPGTRAKAASLVRQRFLEAQEYRDKLAKAKDDPDEAPDRDLGLEALVEVLEGRRIVHHHTHRHDDIVTVLRIAEEFGYRVVLHHVSEAWKVADEIAAANAPCSIIMIDSPGGKLEAKDIRWENAPVLEQAGVDVAIHTDDYITDSRLFLRSAGLAVRAGMSRAKALEALTLAGARMLDLDDRVGSLEAGKDADFVVLSGDPLSVGTQVLETWVEGERVFDRSDEQDRLWAVGGWDAGWDRVGVTCCAAPQRSEVE